MAKRPKFSRWRRLPGVFRTGDHRPNDSGAELDRVILYVPARILDMAEALAEKAGVPTVQDYCALLLMKALETERVQQKVADIEVRRGPLVGLKQIADDPDYLAEWQERSDAKPESPSENQANHDGPGKIVRIDENSVTVDILLPDVDLRPRQSLTHSLHPTEDEQEIGALTESMTTEPDAGVVPIVRRQPTVLKMTDSRARDVILRHAAQDEDQGGFLPSLRRGEAVAAAKSAELIFALNQLERELTGADVIERRLSHGLHRLALESQVLLTDAWQGVFDDRTITAIRTVQEAVERILSGQDIRYYPQSPSPGSERPH